MCELKGDLVTYAVFQDTYYSNNYSEYEGIWYNGKNMTLSNNMPVSKSNTIKCKDFMDGCILGVKEYLISISDENPEIINLTQFQRLARIAGIKIT